MEQCNTCKYAVDSGSPALMCHRNPIAVKVLKAHWCGEYRLAHQKVEPVFQRPQKRGLKREK